MPGRKPIGTGGPRREIDQDALVTRYTRAGWSMARCGRAFGISTDRVRSILRARGVQRRVRPGRGGHRSRLPAASLGQLPRQYPRQGRPGDQSGPRRARRGHPPATAPVAEQETAAGHLVPPRAHLVRLTGRTVYAAGNAGISGRFQEGKAAVTAGMPGRYLEGGGDQRAGMRTWPGPPGEHSWSAAPAGTAVPRVALRRRVAGWWRVPRCSSHVFSCCFQVTVSRVPGRSMCVPGASCACGVPAG